MLETKNISELVADVNLEISAVKSVVENSYSQDHKFQIPPIIVFYSDAETRSAVASAQLYEEFEDTLSSISEILSLYSFLNSHSATVTINSKVSIDDNIYESLNIFVINYFNAWSITVPFTYDSDNYSINWLDDHITQSLIDDEEFDQTGRDIVTMLYFHVNNSEYPYSIEDLLSYLSTTKSSITFMNNQEYSFFDFSSSTLIQTPPNE